MIVRSLARRPGTAALDVVVCAGVAVPIAAALYWLFEEGLAMYSLTLGTAVGWPL